MRPAGSMYHRPAWPCGIDAKALGWPKERSRLRASKPIPASQGGLAPDNRLMLSWIVAHPLAYPALEVLHIVGIGLLLGNLVLLEMRVWGRGGELPVQPLARLALGLAALGFALAGASGLLMFAAQAIELLGNRAFVIKMGLLMLAGMNAAWFHGRGSLARMDRTARWLTVVSSMLWLAVIVCGRSIAYV